MEEKRVELFQVWPYSSDCSQDVGVIFAHNYQLVAEHKSLFPLREGAALLLPIAPEYVLPGLVARWLSS